MKRFLRDLHRGHEKDEKDKERAKSEVARLNGLVTGGGSVAGPSSSSSGPGIGKGPTPSIPKQYATPAQRKQQLAQLAEMGVSIPDEFRPDMAMPGEWEVTEERIIGEDGEKKVEATAMGIHTKRALEEEDEEALEAKKRRWGSTYRTYPGQEDHGDLDALLNNMTKGKGPSIKTEVKDEAKPEIKDELGAPEQAHDALDGVIKTSDAESPPPIKREPSDGASLELPQNPTAKEEVDEAALSGPIFKKRKAKTSRQVIRQR